MARRRTLTHKNLQSLTPAQIKRAMQQSHLDFEETLARRRLGRTAEEKLRWVVTDFAGQDLRARRAEGRAEVGYDLRALIPIGWQVTTTPGPMSDELLFDLQNTIGSGLRALLESRTWELPARAVWLERWGPVNGNGRPPRHRIRMAWAGDEREAILAGVADLLLQEGDRLRACENCRKPFVARKRQEYCSTVCSQRTRNIRKARKRPKKRKR